MKQEEKSRSLGQTLRRLGVMVKRFLQSPSGAKARLFLAALLLLMLCINGLNVLNSFVGRYFMSAIESRDWDGFYRFAWLYFGVFALQTTVGVCFRFTEERLGLHWRDWLTRRVVNLYLDDRTYFHLEETGGITNPDQRIAEDVKSLTVSTLSFFLMILNGTMTVLSFAGVLWSISPTLFAVAVVYAAAGSGLTILFGKPLIRLNYRQSDCEADFRSELIRVRDHVEGLALTGSEPVMLERLMARVDRLVANFRRIIAVNRNLSFFTTGYNYLIQLIPTLLVAPLFMRHGIEFGIIGQSGMAFATLLGAFSLVVTQFQSISAYASVVTRLGELVDAVESVTTAGEAGRIKTEVSPDRFEFRDLTLTSAGERHRILINQLNASVLPGQCVLVTGPNDIARQTLLRAAASLHSAGSGTMVRPPSDKIAFLPEQPYLLPGTARALLVRPDDLPKPTEEEVRGMLRETGLASAMEKHDGFEAACDWDDILSFEERQLMAVTRVLLARPAFVLADRLESSLSPEAHKRAMHLMAARGISCILFSRGKPDPSLHDACLELHDDGRWTWKVLR